MSNIAYRVILERPSDERPIFFALTAAFVALLVFAAVGLVLDVHHRKATVAPALEFPAEQLFRQSFLTGVDAYHEGRTPEIVEADVLWCDRPAVEQYINELNTRGLPTSFDGKIVERDTRSFWASLPFLKDIVGGKVERERVREWTADPSRVGDPERLNKLIPFLVRSHLLSPFVGDPGEFDALDKVVHQVFKPFDQTRGGGNGDTLLRWENPLLLSVVSRHLQEVLAYAEKQPSSFGKRGTWKREEINIFSLKGECCRPDFRLMIRDEWCANGYWSLACPATRRYAPFLRPVRLMRGCWALSASGCSGTRPRTSACTFGR